MLKILLPVDFSETSDSATQLALTLAAKVPGAHLLLLHCFQDYLTEEAPVVATGNLSTTEAITEQVLHRNELEAQQLLDELYDSIQTQTRASGQRLILERAFVYGLPEDVIPAQIKGYKPTLVVMGTVAEQNLSRSLFGTIITNLLHDIKVPLLSVPQTYDGSPIRNVLYATDFDKTDYEAITSLQQLLMPFDIVTHCVHISDGDMDSDSEKLATLQQKLRNTGHTDNIRYTLLEGDDVAETLQDYVSRENINLIALTTHERSLLDSLLHSSLAKKMVIEATVPLLIFHSN